MQNLKTKSKGNQLKQREVKNGGEAKQKIKNSEKMGGGEGKEKIKITTEIKSKNNKRKRGKEVARH